MDEQHRTGLSGRRASSPSLSPRRNYGRNDDSWVEISSQPSSSSLSSIGDEIVTTGLRVSGPLPRRRRSHPPRYQFSNAGQDRYQGSNNNAAGGTTSSQEGDYEASESEEDRNLASSTENMPTQQPPSSQMHMPSRFEAPADSDTDDDDENATALGTRRRSNDHAFRPQPNVFSNPPAGMGPRSHSAMNASSVASQHPHSGVRRPLGSRTQTSRARQQQNPMSYQADHDAALRASLNTLLSCAAAARSRPKNGDEETQKSSSPAAAAGVGPSNQPVELRLVPESELMGEDQPAAPTAATTGPSQRPPSRPRTTTTTGSSARSSSKGSSDKGKRAATTAARGSRASKKKKTAVVGTEDALISPTLMTWVVSAGVVVLVSVVGFGAGYVIGREVGRQEGFSAGAGTSLNASDTTSCGRDMMRSSGGTLRRWRWGTSMKTVVA